MARGSPVDEGACLQQLMSFAEAAPSSTVSLWRGWWAEVICCRDAERWTEDINITIRVVKKSQRHFVQLGSVEWSYNSVSRRKHAIQ